MLWKSGFNELFPLYTQDSVRVCFQDEYAMRALFFSAQEEEAFLCTYIYIYINKYIHTYHTLHTLFGPLDLMDQLSELGWAHKKSRNNLCPAPLWTTL